MSLNDNFVKACTNGNLPKVKALLRRGADIHVMDDFALRCAACYGHLDVVKYLVGQGADIHARGYSALRWAAEKEHPEVVNFLREAATGGAVEKPSETGKKLTVKVRKFPRAEGK